MAPEEKTPDMIELLRSKIELERNCEELDKRLEDSQKTILSLEERLDGISKTLGNVMELMKTMCPDAFEEFMKKKQNTEEENLK